MKDYQAELLATFARKQVVRFQLRQMLALVLALVTIALTAISVIELFFLQPDGIQIVIAATACFLWWMFMRPMLHPPIDLTCPACGRPTAAILQRKTSVGYEWDLSCAQCGKRVETRLGDA